MGLACDPRQRNVTLLSQDRQRGTLFTAADCITLQALGKENLNPPMEAVDGHDRIAIGQPVGVACGAHGPPPGVANGHAFRTFNVLDDYNREGLGIDVNFSLFAAKTIFRGGHANRRSRPPERRRETIARSAPFSLDQMVSAIGSPEVEGPQTRKIKGSVGIIGRDQAPAPTEDDCVAERQGFEPWVPRGHT